MGRGPQDGPQLGAEQITFLEGKADRTQPHDRVGLIEQIQLGNELVAADIEGADRHRMRRHRLDGCPVGRYCSSSEGASLAVHEQKFGPEQPDLRPLGAGCGDLLVQLDVAAQGHAVAVAGLGRQVTEDLQLLFQVIVALLARQIFAEGASETG